MKDPTQDEIIERLTQEIRQQKTVITEIRLEFSRYIDLGKLSLKGAASYLIRHKLMLDEVKRLLQHASRNPDAESSVLMKIEKLVKESD